MTNSFDAIFNYSSDNSECDTGYCSGICEFAPEEAEKYENCDEGCFIDDDCQSGWCVGGQCADPFDGVQIDCFCDEDYNCQTGYCPDGSCQLIDDCNPIECSDGSQCLSGSCLNGQCGTPGSVANGCGVSATFLSYLYRFVTRFPSCLN